MVVHHVVTIALLVLSWGDNFVRVGSMVLVTHDAVDYWMEVLMDLNMSCCYNRVATHMEIREKSGKNSFHGKVREIQENLSKSGKNVIVLANDSENVDVAKTFCHEKVRKSQEKWKLKK